ncbi:hypothetical protein HDV05_001180 [Chytridiales sp. JEL 0842]|nr:hypothetical protein HDV05_001180 [Chytridiales sp. JEL 0842]
MKSITVFCGSSSGNHSYYAKCAEDLGDLLVKRNIRLVYGGGSIGLMGRIANRVHEAGGQLLGVIPEALTKHEGISLIGENTTVIVKDMHTRKQMMCNESDGFIALPGGFGTFEELLEMITWSQLSIHAKPIGVLNVNGFYDSLIQLIDHGVKEGFIRPENKLIVIFKDNAEELLDALINYKIPNGRYNLNWSNEASELTY